MSFYYPGDRVRVFYTKEWEKTGDVGDNDKFWLPATIEFLYDLDGFELADVRFDGQSKLSKGHFTEAFKEI